MARKTADLPLHSGAAPAWLFRRMVDMAGAIGVLIVRDLGPQELLRRLSDPFWFQAFGCVLGFDWHSSGVTTTVCGALKEAARKYGSDLGIVVCGGKGATSRKTPEDIRRACERTGNDAAALVYASNMAAKVDSAAVQDGYQLYHHSFLLRARRPQLVRRATGHERTGQIRPPLSLAYRRRCRASSPSRMPPWPATSVNLLSTWWPARATRTVRPSAA